MFQSCIGSRSISTLVLSFFLPACTTTHVNTAVPLAQTSVNVSCSIRNDIQVEAVSVISCAMENSGKDWQDLVIRGIRFPDQGDITIVSPNDLQTLVVAYREKKKRSDSNVDLALGGLIIGGMMVAAGSGNSSARTVGRMAAIGGTAAAIGKEASKSATEAQYSGEHLLSGNLRVPPDLSLRRQIVVNNPTNKPTSMEICWEVPKDVCSVMEL